MLFLTCILLAITGASTLLRAAIPASHVVHEERNKYGLHNWIKRDRVAHDSIIPVRIGLTQRNVEKGEDLLLDVSDPNSKNYLKHWTAEEVLEYFRPSQETIDVVTNWLVSSGISTDRINQSFNKGWLVFNSTGHELENLLLTEYYEHEYEPATEKYASIACDRYYLPQAIQEHIDMINPGVAVYHRYERRELHTKRQMELLPPNTHIDAMGTQNCSHLTTPACIRALYHIPFNPKRTVTRNNSLGLYESEHSYDQPDLDEFFTLYAPFVPNGTHPLLDSIHHRTAPSTLGKANPEATIDLETIYPILYPAKVVLYQAPLGKDIFEQWIEAIDGAFCTKKRSPNSECGIYKPANAISVSYGAQEVYFPAAYQKRQCAAFMKLGLQGSSIFVASGDSGVQNREIVKPFGRCLGPSDKIFSPTYPTGCYAITTVSATKILANKTVHDPEVAWTYSGGGFSNLFPAPKYQKAAIATYFERAGRQYQSYTKFGINDFNNTKGRYNRLGRAYPDVSANGKKISAVYRGYQIRAAGTSNGPPIWASIITLINEERMSAGKPPIGFLNPILYQNPQVLNDIVRGHNYGCGTNGFKTAKGWDPVTGLGTPSYPKLRELLMNA